MDAMDALRVIVVRHAPADANVAVVRSLFRGDDAIPAALARRLASYILTETMERRPSLGFDSYDRFFPSQDTLPQGGFGNLIALPLQKEARDRGNTVFVDDHLVPYSDQ